MKKESILHIVIVSLISLLPLGLSGVDYQEYNQREMESKLHYGDSIKDDTKWQEYSEDVKEQVQARWEADAERRIMAQLGLQSIDELSGAEASEYTNALIDWELKADSTIDAMYGVWRARQDWSLSPDIVALRNILKAQTWLNSTVLTNLSNNVAEMKSRVRQSWSDYYVSKQTEVSNYMAGLLGSPVGLNNNRYADVIESYAQHHLNALAVMGRSIMFQEQEKYLNYINRMSVYQDMVSGTNFIFDELWASNYMAWQASNVNQVASNLVNPVTAVKKTISSMQSNLNALSQSLMVPETPEEDIEVAIEDWEEMVQGYYRDGLTQWDDALKGLTLGMNGWMSNAMLGYEQGLAEWNQAYSELTNAKVIWVNTMSSNLNQGILSWQDKLRDANLEYDQSLTRLSEEITRVQDDYGRYHQGMMNIFLEGGATLQSIEQNLEWLTMQLSAARADTNTTKESEIQSMLSQWTTLKTNYEKILSDSQDSLREELFSGELGQGIYSNVTGQGVDIYLRSDLEMQYALRAEELKYAKQRMDIARSVMLYAQGESGFDQAELSNSIYNLKNQLNTLTNLLNDARTDLETAISHTDLSNANLNLNNQALFTARTNMNALQSRYNTARTNFDYHQQLAAILSAGQETVQARAGDYIRQALAEYVQAQAYYDNAHRSYYSLFLEADLEQKSLDLYQGLQYYDVMSISNTTQYQAMADAWHRYADLTDIADYIDTNAYYGLTNNNTGLDWQGYVESVLALSNERAVMMQKISEYLKTGDTNQIKAYIDYDAPSAWMHQNSFIQKTAAALESFSQSVSANGAPFASFDEAFDVWRASLDQLSVSNTQYFDKSVRYAVWTLTHGNSDLVLELTNAGFTPDIGRFIQEYTDQADILQEYSADEDYELSEQGAHNYLVHRFGSQAVNQDWDVQTYRDWMDLLLYGGGKFREITHYYTAYLYDQDLGYDLLMQEAWQRAEGAREILAQKELVLCDISLVPVNNQSELFAAIMELTNHIQGTGSALGQYISDMVSRVEVLRLDTRAASNQMAQALNSYTNMAPAYFQRQWLYENQDMALNLEYISSLLSYSNVPAWNVARDYIISGYITNGLHYQDQAGLERDIYNQLTNMNTLGIFPIHISNTYEAVKDRVIQGYLENLVISLIGGIDINNSGSWNLGLLTNALQGWDEASLDRAAACYRLLSWEYVVQEAEKGGAVNTNDWYTVLSHQDLDKYQEYTALYEQYKNNEALSPAPSPEGEEYRKILLGLIDKREYLSYLSGRRAFIDCEIYDPLSYLLYDQYQDKGLEEAYSQYLSALDEVIPSIGLALYRDRDEITLLQNNLTLTNRLLSLKALWTGGNELRSHQYAGLIETLTDNTNQDYRVQFSTGGWDHTVSNTLTVNTGLSDSLNELYTMYLGLGSLVSNYNARYEGYTNSIGQVLQGSLRYSNDHVTALSDGSLVLRQQELGSIQSQMRGAVSQMLLWADSWTKADQGQNYIYSADYVNARDEFQQIQQDIETRQDAYFTVLSNHDVLLDGYYQSLALQSTLKKQQEALAFTNRMLLAQYQYAMTAWVVGTETNASATASISNFIDPVRDYDYEHSNYTVIYDDMETLAAQIEAEKVLTQDQEKQWAAYQEQYAAKLRLQALMEEVARNQYPAERAMQEAWQQYTMNAAELLGGAWQQNSVTAQLAREIGEGVVTASDYQTLISGTLGNRGFYSSPQSWYTSYQAQAGKKTLAKLLTGTRDRAEMESYLGTARLQAYNDLSGKLQSRPASTKIAIELANENSVLENLGRVNNALSIISEIEAAKTELDRIAVQNPLLQAQKDNFITQKNSKDYQLQAVLSDLAGLEAIRDPDRGYGGHEFPTPQQENDYRDLMARKNSLENEIRNLQYQIDDKQNTYDNNMAYVYSNKSRVDHDLPFARDLKQIAEEYRTILENNQALVSVHRQEAYANVKRTALSYRPLLLLLSINIPNSSHRVCLNDDGLENPYLMGNDFNSYLNTYMEYQQELSIDEAIRTGIDHFMGIPSTVRGMFDVRLGLTERRLRGMKVIPVWGYTILNPYNDADHLFSRLTNRNGSGGYRPSTTLEAASMNITLDRLANGSGSVKGYLDYENTISGHMLNIKENYTEYVTNLNRLSNYTIYLSDSWISNGQLSVLNRALFNQVVTAGQNIAGYDLTSLSNEVLLNSSRILQKIRERGLLNTVNKSISLHSLLQVIQESVEDEAEYSQYQLARYYTNDSSAKVFYQHMLDMLYSEPVFQATPQTSGAFSSLITEIGSISSNSWVNAKYQEAAIQQKRWLEQKKDLGYQMADYSYNGWNLIDTGITHWDAALETLLQGRMDWEDSYMTAYTNGVNTWEKKLDTLAQRRLAWQDLSIEYVNQGSSYEIYEDLKRNMELEINSLLEEDLPEDVRRKVINQAKTLKDEVLLAQSESYQDYFGTMLGASQNADITFVMDGLSRFGGGSRAYREYQQDLRDYQEKELEFKTYKLQEEFRQEMEKRIDNFNEMLAGANEGWRANFEDMFLDSRFRLQGDTWIRKEVIVDATMWKTETQNQALFGYRDLFLSLDGEYITPVLEQITGAPRQFEALLDMQTEKAREEYEGLYSDFTNHIGVQDTNRNIQYKSGRYIDQKTIDANPELDLLKNSESHRQKKDREAHIRTNAQAAGQYIVRAIDVEDYSELDRLTWALSYFNMVQASGWEKDNKMWIDKGMWDTDRDNDGSSDVAIDISLYDGLSTLGGLALSIATAGTASPLIAAAVMASVSMAHSTMNLASGHMNLDQWGAEMLQSGIKGLSSMAGGVWQSAGSLISSGIGVGPNGGLSFNLSGQQIVSWGASTLLNSLNLGGRMQDVIGGAGKSTFVNALAMGVGQGVNSFLSDSLNQGINMAYDPTLQFDWASAGRGMATGMVSGMATGYMNAAMGAGYMDSYKDAKGNKHAAGYRYNDGNGRTMFYNDQLLGVSSTLGGFLGEWTDRALGGSFDLNLGDNMGFHWGTNGVSMDYNASGFSIGQMLQSLGNLKYATINDKFRRNQLGPLSRSSSRGTSENVNDLKFAAVLNRKIEEEWIGYGSGEGGSERAGGDGGNFGDINTGKIIKGGKSADSRADDLAHEWLNQTLNEMDYTIKDGKIYIGGVLTNKTFESYKQEALRVVKNTDNTLLHQNMLRSLTNKMAGGEVKAKIESLISQYTSIDGSTDTKIITQIMKEMQNVTNMAMDYSGMNGKYQQAVNERLLINLEQGLETGNWHTALGTTNEKFGVELMKATNRAIHRYGINDQILESEGTNWDSFRTMFSRQLQHASAVRDKNVNPFSMNSEYGQARMEEYRYFADLRGGKGSFDKAIKAGYVITGEEGLGNYYTTEKDGNGIDVRDVYNDRITIFKDGEITEFYRANLDSTNGRWEKNGSPKLTESKKRLYRTQMPGVYDIETYKRPGREKDPDISQFSFWMGDRVEYGVNKHTMKMRMMKDNGVYNGRSEAALLHRGFKTWSGSTGCSTILQDDFEKLMQMFGEKVQISKDKYIYNYTNSYGFNGMYFLLSQ